MLDANTFSNNGVIQFINQNLINIKIDAETEYGSALFAEFEGTGFPLLLFIDENRNEVDRFYGFYEPTPFLDKVKSIVKGENTFPSLLKQYNLGDNSAETMSLLAKKYADRGDDSLAIALYENVLKSKNVSSEMFHEAKYFIIAKNLWLQGPDGMLKYLEEYADSPFIDDAVNQLLSYFKYYENVEQELFYFDKYLETFKHDPWFLNQYAWRMTEINQNLDSALNKVNLALSLMDKEAQGLANIIDTKAEVLWKLGIIDEAIKTIDEARADGIKITANMYTYTAAATGLDASMPPWVQEGGHKAWVERLKDPSIRKKVLQEMSTPSNQWENLYLAAGSPENILLVGFKNKSLKDLTGKTLSQIANTRGQSPQETAIDLVIEDNSKVSAVYFLMSQENISRKITLPWMSFGSDAASLAPEGVFLNSNPHPRAYGNFSRLLGKYVRQENLISLE